MSEWRDIDTAPKDGTYVALLIPGDGAYGSTGWRIGTFSPPENAWFLTVHGNLERSVFEPSHWLPLPEAPKAP